MDARGRAFQAEEIADVGSEQGGWKKGQTSSKGPDYVAPGKDCEFHLE